jgi:hypothetical protein
MAPSASRTGMKARHGGPYGTAAERIANIVEGGQRHWKAISAGSAASPVAKTLGSGAQSLSAHSPLVPNSGASRRRRAPYDATT